MTKQVFNRWQAAFLATLVVLVGSGLVSWWTISELVQNDRWVNHTQLVLTRLAEVRSALWEAESGQRGYMLTDNKRFLISYEKTLPRIDDALEELTELTRDNESQKEKVEMLRELVTRRVIGMRRLLDIHDDPDEGFQRTQDAIRTGRGEEFMERIRGAFHELAEEELSLLRNRSRESAVHARLAYLSQGVDSLIAIGLLVLVAVVVRADMKRRDAVEKTLRQSEQEFRGTFDLAGVAKAQSDPVTGRLLRVNRKYCELTGYSAGELAGLSFLQLTHPDDRDQDAEQLRRLRAGELEEYDTTKRYLRKNGTVVWVHVTATLVRDAAGRPTRTIAVVQDVTQRKRAEDALRQSEARFRLLAEVLPQIVWTAGPDGRLDYFNRRWTEYSGLTPEQIQQGLDQQTVHPEDRSRLTQAWDRAVQTAEPFETEFRLRRASDGVFRWHLGRALPLRDGHGQVLAWFGTSTDIEDQKQAEQAILQANEELERRVAERTRQLEASNQDLRRATLLAEAASRAKSQFLANVSHEIRTPMNGILGMTEIALDTPLTDRQREVLQVVRSAAQSLLGLLNDILDFSKIEASKLELCLEPFELRREIEDTLKPLALRAQHKGLSYQCRIDPKLPAVVSGDALRLRQVLLNLVGNAVKFTEQGEVVVEVVAGGGWRGAGEETPPASSPATRHPPPATIELHFAVRDTGIGIPAEKLQSIFEPFVQADSSLSREYGGTGLGLSISARLVEMMGGRIEVSSEPGKGSVFSFNARLQTVPDEDQQSFVDREPTRPRDQETDASSSSISLPASLPAAHSPGVPVSSFSSRRVLLVEDNDFNRQVGVYLLERQGYRVAVACSGAEALDRLEREQFDLVLMDLGMPGMDGLETTAAIRRREAERGVPNGDRRRVPIVALTAHVTPADQERCLQAGMDGHVSKPLNPDQLREVLGQVIGSEPRPPGSGGRPALPGGRGSASAAIFDRDRTLQRLSGNSKLFAEVVKLFQENSERLLAQMRQALSSGEGATLKQTAHTLKGSMSFFNAPAAVAAAANMEKQAENAAERSQALADLEREVETLRSALTEAVRELSPA